MRHAPQENSDRMVPSRTPCHFACALSPFLGGPETVVLLTDRRNVASMANPSRACTAPARKGGRDGSNGCPKGHPDCPDGHGFRFVRVLGIRGVAECSVNARLDCDPF